MTRFTTMIAAGVLTLGTAGAGMADHLKYFGVDLMPLNESGVSGRAVLTFAGAIDGMGPMLTVDLLATGLTPGAHPGHIHGFTGTDFKDSIAPTADVFDPDVAGDGDGFTELTEGAPFYGGIIQTLTGLTANDMGVARYRKTFDVEAGGPLDDGTFGLESREIVLHGLFTDFAIEVPEGFPGGNVDATISAPGTYNALLPNSVGELKELDGPSAVPIPAAGYLLVAALGGLGWMRRRRS